MRIYVVNHSKTHRDKYVSNGKGDYLHFACDLPPAMQCQSPWKLNFSDLTQLKAYSREAKNREAMIAEEVLEASSDT